MPAPIYQNKYDCSFTELYYISSLESLVFYGDYNGDIKKGLKKKLLIRQNSQLPQQA
jgi:hypothetical protein